MNLRKLPKPAAVNQAIFGLAPATLGILREVFDGYLVPFVAAAVVQIVAAAVVLRGRCHRLDGQLARD